MKRQPQPPTLPQVGAVTDGLHEATWRGGWVWLCTGTPVTGRVAVGRVSAIGCARCKAHTYSEAAS